MVHFFLFSYFFSQICQWIHQSNFSWNCSIQIVLIKITKMKGKTNETKGKKNESNFYEWFISFSSFFFSQKLQWSHQSNFSWNCSIQIVLIKITKMKRMQQVKKKFLWMVHFFLFFFFFSQIVQWIQQSNLSWNCSSQIVLPKLTKMKGKSKWKKREKNKTNFYDWMVLFLYLLFFLLTDLAIKSPIQFELESFHSDCFDKEH